jgi:hypothetical protein
MRRTGDLSLAASLPFAVGVVYLNCYSLILLHLAHFARRFEPAPATEHLLGIPRRTCTCAKNQDCWCGYHSAVKWSEEGRTAYAALTNFVILNRILKTRVNH